VAYGDKSIGTNQILPTSLSARYTEVSLGGKFLNNRHDQKDDPAGES